MQAHPPVVFLVAVLIAFVALVAVLVPLFAQIAQLSTP